MTIHPRIDRADDEQILAMYTGVAKHARRELGSRNIGSVDADDASQQAMLEILQRPAERLIHNPNAYSKGVVRNVIRSTRRKEKIGKRRLLQDNIEFPALTDKNFSDTIDKLFRQVYSILTRNDRRVLDRMQHDEVKASEIASALGMTLDATYASMSRIRACVERAMYADIDIRSLDVVNARARDRGEAAAKSIDAIDEYAALYRAPFQRAEVYIWYACGVNHSVHNLIYRDSPEYIQPRELDLIGAVYELSYDAFARVEIERLKRDKIAMWMYYERTSSFHEDRVLVASSESISYEADMWLDQTIRDQLHSIDLLRSRGKVDNLTTPDVGLLWRECSDYCVDLFGQQYVAEKTYEISHDICIEPVAYMIQ